MKPTGRPRGAVYPFRRWRERLGLSIPEVTRLLARDEKSIRSYDKLADLPRALELAMAAVEHLPSWHLRKLNIEPYWRNRPPS